MDREKTIELSNEYYIAKYNIFKLSSNNRIILLY